MSLDTHEQVDAWLSEQAAEAAGAMIMCAPADIAGGDPRAKGAFESVVMDAIDGLTKDPSTFDTACEVLKVERSEDDTPEAERDRLHDALRERLWQETRTELKRVATDNADNPDKIDFAPRF